MSLRVVFTVLSVNLLSQAICGSHIDDHSWTSVNCQQFELVIEDSSNYTSDQILLQSGDRVGFDSDEDTSDSDGTPSLRCDGDEDCVGVAHCFGVKRFSKDILAYDNYGISVSMLTAKSSPGSENFGLMGLIFNFKDNGNYDYVYLTSRSHPLSTTLLPPKGNVVTPNRETNDAGSQAAITSNKEYYFQTGYRINGAFVAADSILLNGSIAENVWHRMSLIVDKDSTSNIQLFFDGAFLGRFSENLPPRDIGGVLILNKERSFSEEEGFKGNRALFKNFVIGRCLRFDSQGECIERPSNCPESYVSIAEKCFFISNTTEIYFNAVTQCGIKGGKLYEPRDAETFLILMRYLKNVLNYSDGGVYRTWLGISDREEEGNNVYESDGATIKYEFWQNSYGINRDPLYYNGQVDGNDCAYVIHFTTTSLWYQGGCTNRFRYICERPE